MKDAAILDRILKEARLIEPFESDGRRHAAQSLVYLLQELGTGLGYWFNWYVRSPYSEKLSKAILAMRLLEDETIAQTAACELSEKTLANIARLRAACEGAPLPVADWLDLLAVAHYLYWFGEEAQAQIPVYRPQGAEHVDAALACLQNAGILARRDTIAAA